VTHSLEMPGAGIDHQCPTREPHVAQSKVLCSPVLGFRCSMISLLTDNPSFIGAKLSYEITLTEWLKGPNSCCHCS